jgi:beta-glucanase (GH16 family)
MKMKSKICAMVHAFKKGRTITTTLALMLLTTFAWSQSWTQVWSDEFNGTGQPNTANWNYEVGNGYNPGLPGFQGWGNGEWEWYRPENCYQQSGNLVIRADYSTTPYYTVGGRNWYQKSGRITTHGKQSWQYGKIEARIKLPTAVGNWCAFWMMGTSVAGATNTSSYNPPADYYDVMANNWASCGEVDIMEHVNGGNIGINNCFWDNRIGLYPWTAGQNANYGNTNVNYGDVTQFHVYSLEWDATYMKWFLDGVQTHIIDITPAQLEEFRKPFYLIFNMALGGSITGTPNAADFPLYMYVDYVRVYKPGTANTPPTANAGADKSITLPTNTVTINGTGTDPGGSISAYAWTRVSGPNTPTLTNANTANLTASGLIAGTYIFRLTVTDNGGLTASDDVNVVVGTSATINLALNKATTVSSTEAAGLPGSAAVDGSLSTRWSSAFSDPQWIYVDLGASYNVNRVKITWEAAYGKNYQVQIATAAAGPWTTMRTVTGNTTLVNDQTGLAGTGRYVRINGTARGTVYGYSIYELEVYGTATARIPIPETNSVVNDEIIFYPNPVDNTVYLEGVEEGQQVVIHNTTGSLTQHFKVNDKSVDVTTLPPGAYIIQLPKQNKYIRKILIKK